MITEKQRAERLRRHEELKQFYSVRLKLTESEPEKEHLEARIAEIERDIEATKLKEPEVPLVAGETLETLVVEEEEGTPENPSVKQLAPQYHNKKPKKVKEKTPFQV